LSFFVSALESGKTSAALEKKLKHEFSGKLKNNIPKERKEKIAKKISEIRQAKKNEIHLNALSEYKTERQKIREKAVKEIPEGARSEFKKDMKTKWSLLKNLNQSATDEFHEALNANTTAEERADFEYIEPNYYFELQEIYTPNDPLFTEQWSLDSIFSNGYPSASGNTKKVVIAIIDTGVDFSHEDLSEQAWTAETCFDESGVEIRGGCFQGGYDFIEDDTNPSPDASEAYAWHGTAVAGIVGAIANNETGMVGAGDDAVEIMAIRASLDGIFELDNLVRSVYFAVQNGADVINISVGGPDYSQALFDAIEYAHENNTLVITAAGNYGLDNDTNPIYPANFDLENNISVAATDETGDIAWFSNYGQNTVKIAAPGDDVTVTLPGNQYQKKSGTSFSVPFVAAIVGRHVAENDYPDIPSLKSLLFGESRENEALSGKVQNSLILGYETQVSEGNNDTSGEDGSDTNGEEGGTSTENGSGDDGTGENGNTQNDNGSEPTVVATKGTEKLVPRFFWY